MATTTQLGTEHEPAENWTDVSELDGININRGEGCPHCGATLHHLFQHPAGHFHCGRCFAHWAGNRENATLHEEPTRGPAVRES